MTDIRKEKFSNMSAGWYAYDLDGTIVKYEGWKGIDHIGEPVNKLIKEMNALLAEGKDVRIFTARVYPIGVDINVTNLTPDEYLARMMQAKLAKDVIDEFSVKHFGKILPTTCIKDFGMISLSDDRSRQVVPNTGLYLEEIVENLKQGIITLQEKIDELETRLSVPAD